MFAGIRREGKFVLSSGKSPSIFYDFDLLSPDETAQSCKRLVKLFSKTMISKIDFIAAPAVGGIIPGFLTAFALDKPFVCVDKDGGQRGPLFMSSNYLIIDDVVSTFQAVTAVQKALGSNCCIGVGAYMFRGDISEIATKNFPVHYLVRGEQEE